MISNQNTSTDPQLSREEAIELLNTPDENLDELIARAEKLRRKYKGNHVSIHILTNARSGNCSQDCAYCAQSCPVQKQTLISTNGSQMRNYMQTMILSMSIICHATVSDLVE